MANPHQLASGNTAFGRLSALNSPIPLRSGTPLTNQPHEFMVRQLAQARSALRLSEHDLSHLTTSTLSGTIPSESTTITLPSQLVQGLLTISHELSGVTKALATISEENEHLREEMHDNLSQLANLPPTQDEQPSQGNANLQASIRDLSYRVSAPTPVLPQAPAPTRRAPPPPPVAGPPPSRKGKKGPKHPPPLPQPQLRILNTSYHSTI